MDGIRDFRKFQLGREVKNGGGAGTPVAATAIMRGQWVGQDDTPINYPAENIGMIVETTRGYIPFVLGSINQGPDPLTFEQFPYILAAAIRGIEKGQADGIGSGKIYQYPWPMTAAGVELIAATLSFTTATKTIADSANGLGFIKPGDLIRVSGAVNGPNNGIFTVATAAAGAITTIEAITTEPAGATITIEVLTQVYTAEGGNNALVERSSYSYPTSFELSGNGGADQDAIMLSSSWITRQWSKLAAGFTAGIALPTVSEVLFGHSKLYIDAIGGTIGTTEKTDTLEAFSYKATTGLKHQFAGTGNLFFSKVERKSRVQLACSISMFQNAAALVEYEAWRNQTPRLIRIKIEGPALATPGTTYTKKTLMLDMPGTWTSFPSPDEVEGAEVLVGEFRPAYDPVAGIGPSITVVNELAALP